jgi:hypothetical protein
MSDIKPKLEPRFLPGYLSQGGGGNWPCNTHEKICACGCGKSFIAEFRGEKYINSEHKLKAQLERKRIRREEVRHV